MVKGWADAAAAKEAAKKKLPKTTPGEIWTANMPDHFFLELDEMKRNEESESESE